MGQNNAERRRPHALLAFRQVLFALVTMKAHAPKTRERLDAVDIQLLRLLQDDGRITNADLARRVGLSPPSVLQRVRKLEESGLVSSYTAILDPDKMGY